MRRTGSARSAGLIVLTLLLSLWALAPALGAPGNDRGRDPGELPPGLEGRDQLPPGLRGRDLPPGLQRNTIRFLHHNDGESDLLPDEGIGGIAEFATLIDTLRAEFDEDNDPSTGAVLISAGDNFLAGPELNASFDNGFNPFYDALGLDLIGYDALIIGNHEFDFGPDVLEAFVRGFSSPPPVLSANLDFSAEPGFGDLTDADGPIAASTVVTVGGRDVGIVGATTENLPFVSSPRNVVVEAVAPAVQAEIDMLTDDGIDIIVLASHLQGLSTDEVLLAQLRDVDVAIAGGGDELLANPGDQLAPDDEEDGPAGPYPTVFTDADGDGIPVVTGPGDYVYLGALDVVFDDDGEVVSWSGGPVLNSGFSPNPEIKALVQDPVEEYLEVLANTVIADSEVALDGRRPGIRQSETNLGNLMADSQLWQANELVAAAGLPTVQVALQNGGGIRNNDLRGPGDITELDTFDIAPFDNFIAVFPALERSVLKDVLENAVSRFEGSDPSGRWAHVAGLDFTYDPAGAAYVPGSPGSGSRIVDVTLDDGTQIVVGGAVQPGDPITVATLNFLANGGDQYPFGGAPFEVLGTSYQQALFNYIVDELGGSITAADYPEGGEGRITQLP